MPRGLILLPVLMAVALAGCGNERGDPPDVAAPSTPLRLDAVTMDGVRFRAPQGGWRVEPGAAPLVATATSGSATVAIWRYPRTEPLPADRAALAAARRRLVREIRKRDPSFDVARTALLRVNGARAIQVRGQGRIGSAPRTVRSTHIFDRGAEVVVDAYAPDDVFRPVDRTVFRPLMRSVRVRPPSGG